MGTKVSVNEILQDWKDLVDGATITLDQAEPYNKFRVTLGGNRILAIVNETSGNEFLLQLGQDATGGRTVTWFSKNSTTKKHHMKDSLGKIQQCHLGF